MLTQKSQPMLLKLLDKSHKAKFRRKDLAELLSEKDSNTLFDKGVLSLCDPGPDTAPCPLGHHDGDGLVQLSDEQNGKHSGICLEHGQLVTLPKEQVGWVEFNPDRWASAVQGANGMTGDTIGDSSGFRLLGTIKTQTLKVGLIAVSSQTSRNPSSYRPPGDGDMLAIFVKLGETAESSNGDKGSPVVGASELFQSDLITIRKEVIGQMLDGIRSHRMQGMQFLKYSDGQKNPTPLTAKQYDEELLPKNIKKQDLVIDLSRNQAWRSGKEVKFMKNKGEGGRKKKLSSKGLMLVAHYIKNPGRHLNPSSTPPYSGLDDSRDPTTSMVMLANMRRTLALDEVIQTQNNPSGTPGGRLYVFNPAGFKYILITTNEET